MADGLVTGVLDAAVLLGVGVAGAWAGVRLRLPFGALLGALLAVAGLQMVTGDAFALHGNWQLAAQILIGTAVGSQIGRGLLGDLRATVAPTAVAVAGIVGTGLVLGLALSWLGALDRRDALFGLLPGGVGEMTAAATALGGDGPLVAAIHLVRLLAVLSLLPVFARLLLRRRRDDRQPPDEDRGSP